MGGVRGTLSVFHDGQVVTQLFGILPAAARRSSLKDRVHVKGQQTELSRFRMARGSELPLHGSKGRQPGDAG
jgi:hypothetical protein